ncbi:class I SAM-dependent methyltransferase [Streptomyces sp. NPDC002845]
MGSKTKPSAYAPTGGGTAASLPSYAFAPSDPWTVTFQAGLARAGLRDSRVYEVGVGSGANVLFMLRQCGAELVVGSDLDPRLPVLAQKLVTADAPDLAAQFRPVEGSVSLIDGPVATAEVAMADAVVACLPQVPDPGDAMYARFRAAHLQTVADGRRRVDDHVAHYYSWAEFNDYPFNSVGLGLIEALLSRGEQYAPRAQVILNLGCRIGKGTLLQLFRSHGYRPEELASQIVRQDEDTDISFFVTLEAAMRGTGHEKDFECEFYADEEGTLPISATEAKERLDADPPAPVFHEICVLRGRLQA